MGIKNQDDQDVKYIPVPCDADNPRRCVGETSQGQCKFLAIPDMKYCPIHAPGGTMGIILKRQEKALYDIKRGEVLHRLNQFRSHPDSKNLTVELGIIRLTLEEILNKCESNWDFVANSATILRLTEQIEKLLKSNIRVEQLTGELMTLEQVTQIAQALITLIAEHVTDVEVIQKIADGFNHIINNSQELIQK